MYDPCGTQKLEGDEMIRRLAKHLHFEPQDLETALFLIAMECKTTREYSLKKGTTNGD